MGVARLPLAVGVAAPLMQGHRLGAHGHGPLAGATHEARGDRAAALPLWREAARTLDGFGHPEAARPRARLRGEGTDDPAATKRASGDTAG
ncbi:hypothetical protein SUDANB178_07411 [Streptomyces sp. enrichment culture]